MTNNSPNKEQTAYKRINDGGQIQSQESENANVITRARPSSPMQMIPMEMMQRLPMEAFGMDNNGNIRPHPVQGDSQGIRILGQSSVPENGKNQQPNGKLYNSYKQFNPGRFKEDTPEWQMAMLQYLLDMKNHGHKIKEVTANKVSAIYDIIHEISSNVTNLPTLIKISLI